MQIDNTTFEFKLTTPASWEECCYCYCTFAQLNDDGPHITSIFFESQFEACDLYWALFNDANFIGVAFKNCTFRGCSFADCRFVECTFKDCSFVNDNLGKPCRFQSNRWYNCTQTNTEGLSHEFAAAPPTAAQTFSSN